MKDYSQFGEQAAILEWAEKYQATRSSSRFLDIGAWHPTEFSNTRALFEAGWSGVMIEPSPGPMLNLLHEYASEPRIKLIQALLTPAGDGVYELHVSDDAVSTIVQAHYEEWRQHTDFHGTILVPAFGVDVFFKRFGGFDFVSIDAEGMSVELFNQMLVCGVYPPCVCIEHEGRTTELISTATAKQYRVVFGNGTNLVMVRG